jgi:hypothetical protein
MIYFGVVGIYIRNATLHIVLSLEIVIKYKMFIKQHDFQYQENIYINT